jgi:transposase InsO family protein
MDACSRRIIGWSIDISQKTELVVDALGMAILRRRPAAEDTICIPITARSTRRGHSGSGCARPGCSVPWVPSAIATTIP